MNAYAGTQLEFKNEPSLDALRCGGTGLFYEIPATSSWNNFPGSIRRCNDNTMTWPSDEAAFPIVGNGSAAICMPLGTTGSRWGSDTFNLVDSCRSSYTVVGKVWLCQ